MLTVWDDYPIHQTSYPVGVPLDAGAGRYERYWLTMHDADLTTQVGFGLGVHPNRGVVDAALSVSRGGRQRSVYASGPLTRDRATAVGPLRLEVVEPMRTLRLVADGRHGLAADLTFSAVTEAIEDGHMERRSGPTLISERTRLVQFGSFSGEFTIAGEDGAPDETVTCTPERWYGLRDRSWGSRTTGTAAEAAMAKEKSGIYFAWTLLRFDDECLLVAVNELPDGRSEARTAAVLPLIGPGEEVLAGKGVERGDRFEFDISYAPGTRRAAAVDLVVGPRGAIDRRVTLTPGNVFQMKGLGYSHPQWPHGADHGAGASGGDAWMLADLDPTARENVHVQQLCRAVRADGAVGVGIFEHIAIGPHRPSGLGEGLTPPG